MNWKTIGWAALGGCAGSLVPVPGFNRFLLVAAGVFAALRLARAERSFVIAAISLPAYLVVSTLMVRALVGSNPVRVGTGDAAILTIGLVLSGAAAGALASLVVEGSQPRLGSVAGTQRASGAQTISMPDGPPDEHGVQPSSGGCGRVIASMVLGALGGVTVGGVLGFLALLAYGFTRPEDPDGHGVGLEALAFIFYPAVVGVVVGIVVALLRLRPTVRVEPDRFEDEPA